MSRTSQAWLAAGVLAWLGGWLTGTLVLDESPSAAALDALVLAVVVVPISFPLGRWIAKRRKSLDE